ncbi:hypothetical protein [Beijerinckia sp. L45]|uniref:hypothetical protein n=1 Tax=Beijerinckia sp. L45 TaxID=1641855 RepID=UPI00131AFFE8|nr:hypothetical protein [Beijerinckia sp. L45]
MLESFPKVVVDELRRDKARYRLRAKTYQRALIESELARAGLTVPASDDDLKMVSIDAHGKIVGIQKIIAKHK